ncbi:MAG: FliA/WhiG family RNA polymerase sigma factor [Planctomycetes bacterium]|nr:FliA/WhiG family RNA polymerase sigma factor [Planctomycetota bacterium]
MTRTIEDATQLWKQYKDSGNTEYRNLLIEEYLPLVKYQAQRLSAKLPANVEVEDLTSVGVFGLMDAIDKFDITRGVKFETYCSNRIRGAMLDELRNLDWVPRLVRSHAHKLERAYAAMEARLGRAPTDQEIAGELGLSMEEYDELVKEISAALVLPQGKKWLEKDPNPALETVEEVQDRHETDPAVDMQKKELIDYISKHCSKKERLVLLLYYFEELTMKEIGELLDLSESRVCQIHTKLMVRLRAQLGKHQMDDF